MLLLRLQAVREALHSKEEGEAGVVANEASAAEVEANCCATTRE